MRLHSQWVISHWMGNYVVDVRPRRERTPDESTLTRQFLFVLSHGYRSGEHEARRLVDDLYSALFPGVSNFVRRGFAASPSSAEDERVLRELERAAESGLLAFFKQAPIPVTYTTHDVPVLGPAPDLSGANSGAALLHYVEIELLGPDDEPMAGEAYRLKLPDGRELAGSLDSRGRALVEDISKPGACEVTFPNLEAGAW